MLPLGNTPSPSIIPRLPSARQMDKAFPSSNFRVFQDWPTHPKTVAKAGAGGGAGSADVTADPRVLVGCPIELSHGAGAGGPQEAPCAAGSRTWRGSHRPGVRAWQPRKKTVIAPVPSNLFYPP